MGWWRERDGQRVEYHLKLRPSFGGHCSHVVGGERPIKWFNNVLHLCHALSTESEQDILTDHNDLAFIPQLPNAVLTHCDLLHSSATGTLRGSWVFSTSFRASRDTNSNTHPVSCSSRREFPGNTISGRHGRWTSLLNLTKGVESIS